MKKLGIGRDNAKKKPIPPSRGLARVAEFWDSHDSTEYFSKEDFAPLRTWTRGRRVRHVYVAPDGSQYELIPLRRRPKRTIPA